MWEQLKRWARALKPEVVALWFCAKHPSTPLAAKILAGLVAAYAFSPIDLIPDFVPVLGYLDDLLIVPLGIYVALKLVPAPVLAECRSQAAAWLAERHARPRNYTTASVIVVIWIGFAWLTWAWLAG